MGLVNGARELCLKIVEEFHNSLILIANKYTFQNAKLA